MSTTDTLVDDYDIIDLPDRLVGYSVELLAVDAAGIPLADPGRRLRVVASSNEDAELMELLQLQADEGPCVECFRSAAPISVADLADTSERWPVLAAAMTSRGVFRSVHALPLRLRGEAIGAMNLFHHQPGALPQTTWPWTKRWPTWPPSASCRNAPSAAPRCSTNNSTARRPAAPSSSRPKGCRPSTAA